MPFIPVLPPSSSGIASKNKPISTIGTSFFIGDESVYHDVSDQLQITLVARNAAGASSAQSALVLTAGGDGADGGDGGDGNPPEPVNYSLLSLERASSLLQELTSLMRSTDGQTLDIDAVFDGRGEEAPWFDSGRLRIVSDSGDSLEVLAGTGDPETYQLVSTVNGVTVSEIRRWDVDG